MDQPCSYEDLRDCLHDISVVNRLTFAYRPTLAWLDDLRPLLPRTRPLQIVDVGCGYGDALRRIHRWAITRNVPVVLTGIDLNPDAIRAARKATHPGTGITFHTGDAYTWEPPDGVDVILSSLLTHHLENDEIVQFLHWMESTARLGWFINDLHREAMPYRLFKLLARCTRWHPFVKNDGPVSILRSFRPEDWRLLCGTAGIAPGEYELRSYRPARLCVARLK
jgi:trans-aconitate methyltransferase